MKWQDFMVDQVYSLDSILPSRAMLGLLPKASKCLGWKMVIASHFEIGIKCLFSSRFIHPNFQLRRPRAFDAYPQFVPCIKLCSIRLLPDSAVSCPKAREEKREVGVLEIWCRVERTGIRWEPKYRMCKICIIFSGLNWWGKTYRFPFLFGRILIFRRETGHTRTFFRCSVTRVQPGSLSLFVLPLTLPLEWEDHCIFSKSSNRFILTFAW